MTLIIKKPTGAKLVMRKTWQPMDPDAAAYIANVEAADAAAGSLGGLEEKTKIAIDNFVLGCKADGIWNAIKASCILAGARTLAGALVPLVGVAPTNVGFVSADYNRKTGLVGNGSSKYINSNRTPSDQPQNSLHLSVYVTAGLPLPGTHIGSTLTSPSLNATQIIHNNPSGKLSFTINYGSGGDPDIVAAGSSIGFIGTSRSQSLSYQARVNKASSTLTSASIAPNNNNILVFARNLNGSPNYYASGRLSFYSIGESLDLTLLDARVTELMNTFAAVLP